MEIFRIYKEVDDFEYSPYTDDVMRVSREETVKYVDSEEKAEAFLKSVEDYNDGCRRCLDCPILKLTKRKYNFHKEETDVYCSEKELVFNGNSIYCRKRRVPDYTYYDYERIGVE